MHVIQSSTMDSDVSRHGSTRRLFASVVRIVSMERACFDMTHVTHTYIYMYKDVLQRCTYVCMYVYNICIEAMICYATLI